jgi:hypothetical protein
MVCFDYPPNFWWMYYKYYKERCGKAGRMAGNRLQGIMPFLTNHNDSGHFLIFCMK